MPYTVFPQRARVAAKQPWYSFDAFTDFQNAIRVANFSVVSERQRVLTAMTTLHGASTYPLRKDVRFPEDDDYLSLFLTPELNNLLTKLGSACSYRDMQKDSADKTAKTGGDSAKDAQVGTHYNDAQRLFDVTRADIQRFVFDNNNIFERADVESKLSLKWT